MLLGYLGPDTMLPLTSVIAGTVGVLLMFWRQLALRAKDVARLIQRKLRKGGETSETAIPAPHVEIGTLSGGGKGGASRLRRNASSGK